MIAWEVAVALAEAKAARARAKVKARAKPKSEEEPEMIWYFIGGVLVGAILWLMIAALMQSASRADHHDE